MPEELHHISRITNTRAVLIPSLEDEQIAIETDYKTLSLKTGARYCVLTVSDYYEGGVWYSLGKLMPDGLASGGVAYIDHGSNLAVDDSYFHYNPTDHWLAIGHDNPTCPLDLAIGSPTGTPAGYAIQFAIRSDTLASMFLGGGGMGIIYFSTGTSYISYAAGDFNITGPAGTRLFVPSTIVSGDLITLTGAQIYQTDASSSAVPYINGALGKFDYDPTNLSYDGMGLLTAYKFSTQELHLTDGTNNVLYMAHGMGTGIVTSGGLQYDPDVQTLYADNMVASVYVGAPNVTGDSVTSNGDAYVGGTLHLTGSDMTNQVLFMGSGMASGYVLGDAGFYYDLMSQTLHVTAIDASAISYDSTAVTTLAVGRAMPATKPPRLYVSGDTGVSGGAFDTSVTIGYERDTGALIMQGLCYGGNENRYVQGSDGYPLDFEVGTVAYASDRHSWIKAAGSKMMGLDSYGIQIGGDDKVGALRADGINLRVKTADAQAMIESSSGTGANPLLRLKATADTSAPFGYFYGHSALFSVTRNLVLESDVLDSTRVNWVKMSVEDADGRVTNQSVYIPCYTLTPTGA